MRISLVILACLFSVVGLSQVNDAGLWSSFMLEKDLPNKYTTGIELNSRFNENISELSTLFLEPFISKEWSKPFSTTLSYRALSRRGGDNEFDERDRFNLDFKYKQKVKEVGIQHRLRVQRAVGILDLEGAMDDDLGLRHRLKFDYDVSKKWEVAFAGETFYALQRGNELLHTDIRLKLSADYKIKKRQYLGIGYMVQQEFNRANPLREFIMTVGYTLMIK